MQLSKRGAYYRGKKGVQSNRIKKTKTKKAFAKKLPPRNGSRAIFIKGITGTDPILKDKKPHIAFIGRSNVGKSSTINALLGASIARTSATPGKTREINFFLVDGRMYYVDLPGYGFARTSAKEAEKIGKHITWYLTSPEVRPSCVVIVIDTRVGLTEFDKYVLDLCKESKHTVAVAANKIDKLNQKERARVVAALHNFLSEDRLFLLSAKTKEGIPHLHSFLSDCASRKKKVSSL